MCVSEIVFHLPMGWLKAEAPRKVRYIVVTEAVFHELMSSLKVVLSLNSHDMSVMRTVSQFEMCSPP